MGKAIKVFSIYIVLLLLLSLLLSKLDINSDFHNIAGSIYQVRLIVIPTIIGGIICLWQIIPPKPLKLFLIIYVGLWLFRYLFLFIATQVEQVHLFGKTYQLSLIVANYYKTASRLETPLPFIIFWVIYYFYNTIDQQNNKPTGTA
ncbi:MAG: hypothetical protein RL172_2669 [Bacteroidota bacterium]|jgi:hypothetical protein